MSLATLIKWVLIVLCSVAVCGCGSKSSPEEPETVKTAEQYKAEAEEQIDADNASAELQRLEESIDQEAAELQ